MNNLPQVAPTRKPKYEVRVYPPSLDSDDGNWRVVMICNCGERPEHSALESPGLDDLMCGVRYALVEHENQDKKIRLTVAPTLCKC